MPGVRFDRASAKRIAEGIRKIERIPGGEEDLQRRRAGGLGRSTLWEVTAVQTGPGTVTIKRVDNIDFDLNDPSEKEDILYDPDNEPSVGDRGLLIRLGEGSLFFFRRGLIDDLLMTAYAYVADDNPTTTFGHPNSLLARYTDSTGVGGSLINKIGIGKFVSKANGNYTAIVFPNALFTATAGVQGTVNVIPEIFFDVKLWKITDDFDISSITYNSWTSLTKTAIAVASIEARSTSFGVTITDSASVGADVSTTTRKQRISIGFQVPFGSTEPSPINLDGAFGVGVEMVSKFQSGDNFEGSVHANKRISGGTTYIGYATKIGL